MCSFILMRLKVGFPVNPHPVCGFLQRRTCKGGGASNPPSRSAPDGVRASQKKNERIALNEGKPMVPNFKVSGQLMTSEVSSSIRSGPSDNYLRDAIKSTGMSKSVPNWVYALQNALKSISGENLVILCHPRPYKVTDLE